MCSAHVKTLTSNYKEEPFITTIRMSLLWFLFLFMWKSMIKLSWMRCIHDDIASTHQAVFDDTNHDLLIRSTPEAGSPLSRDKRDAEASSHGEEEYKEEYQPLRVHVHHKDSALVSKDRQEMVKTAVEKAVLKIRSVLSVIPVKDSLLLPRTSCSVVISKGMNKGRCSRMPKGYNGEFCLGIFRIPEKHLGGLFLYNRTHPQPVREVIQAGPGERHADIILYVVTMSTAHCRLKDQSVVAFATHCRVDSTTGRPTAGLVNFCPSAVMRATITEQLLYSTALHEIVHVLGFSTKLFDTFMDCRGETCKKGAYIREVEGGYRLISPNVVNQTRQHFGCHSDRYFGGLLQSMNSAVTSHWDSRMMYTSLMTAEAENVSYPVLDAITLAVLEDSGWYQVDFSKADPFLWGKGAGCLFALPNHCQQNSDYFCSDNSSGCHFLLRDKAVCDAVKTESPCGVYAPIPQGSCTQNVTEYKEGSVEIYSPSSRCFLSSIKTTSAQNREEELEGQCYERRCGKNGTVFVRLQGTGWIPCPPGQLLQAPGLQGQVQCPNNTDILCMEDSLQQASPPPTSPKHQDVDTQSPKTTTTVTTKPYSPVHPQRNLATRSKMVISVENCLISFVVFAFGYLSW